MSTIMGKWNEFEKVMPEYYEHCNQNGIKPICLCGFCKGRSAHEEENQASKKMRSNIEIKPNWLDIPHDTKNAIFLFLQQIDIAKLSMVCKDFQLIIRRYHFQKMTIFIDLSSKWPSQIRLREDMFTFLYSMKASKFRLTANELYDPVYTSVFVKENNIEELVIEYDIRNLFNKSFAFVAGLKSLQALDITIINPEHKFTEDEIEILWSSDDFMKFLLERISSIQLLKLEISYRFIENALNFFTVHSLFGLIEKQSSLRMLHIPLDAEDEFIAKLVDLPRTSMEDLDLGIERDCCRNELKELSEIYPNLQRLCLSSEDDYFGVCFRKLTSLNIFSKFDVLPSQFPSLKKLEYVHLNQVVKSEEIGIHLNALKIDSDVGNIGDMLARYPNLETFEVANNQISKEDIMKIADCPKLKSLSIWSARLPFTDFFPIEHMKQLKTFQTDNLPALKYLVNKNENITSCGSDRLKQPQKSEAEFQRIPYNQFLAR